MAHASVPCSTHGALRVRGAPQDLGEVVSSMHSLNKNLESLVDVGREIERVSDVWLNFHGKVSCQ